MATSDDPVLRVIRSRRATRAFTTATVSDEQIHVLLDAAVHAPTAMHVEPWAFAIVQNRGLLRQISDRAKELAAAAPGPDHRPLAHGGPLADPAFNIFYDAGTLIVICGRGSGPFVAADCWLAAENLMLAATALGLATCPIGFAVAALADEPFRVALGIPAGVTAVAPVIVGVPAAPAPAGARRPPEILSWRR